MRHLNEFTVKSPEEIDYMDVSPRQVVSVAASLIPFLEHDDANRASDGFEHAASGCTHVARRGASGRYRYRASQWPVTQVSVKVAKRGGVIESVDAGRIVVRVSDEETESGEAGVDIYNLTKYTRSNQNTCINQRPIVNQGDQVLPRRCTGRWSIGRSG